MSIGLAVVALGASSVWDVVIQLAFAVADNQVLAANASLLDISCEGHHYSGVGFAFASIGGSQPTWRLALHKLRVVGGNTVRNFGH
jgi:hypothetical protein